MVYQGYGIIMIDKQNSFNRRKIAAIYQIVVISHIIDLYKFEQEIDLECCKIGINLSLRKIAVVTMYRSSSGYHQIFLDKLCRMLDHLDKKYDSLILCGGFNIGG